MNVLILGSGGREHVLAWKIAKSYLLTKLYIAPGNAGTDLVGENINISYNDFEAVRNLIIDKKIDMLVVGPEEPLVNGLYEFLKQDPATQKVVFIGPDKKGAILEGSKQYAKEFMKKNKIPTARYGSFSQHQMNEAVRFLESMEAPYVIKADGLAAGKGVVIMNDLNEARNSVTEMLNGHVVGEAGKSIVIEEFLEGVEVSMFVLTDGKDYLLLPEAKDYKRIGEGDKGLNTGGMGALSPVPFVDDAFLNKVKTQIIEPTLHGLQQEGVVYKGFIFFGLINVEGNPYVIEYNCRMGDPETQVVIPRIKNDLLELFMAVNESALGDVKLEIDQDHYSTVIAVSGGYPQAYEKGKVISGLDKVEDALVFHAGTKNNNGEVLTNGGRVLAITSNASNLKDALNKSYAALEKIHFDYEYFRKDIGWEFLETHDRN